jgi:hypothetical protein
MVATVMQRFRKIPELPRTAMMTIFEKASMIIAALGAPAALWIGNAVSDWIRTPERPTESDTILPK